ncbi:hypothetical protein [Streptomyces sp. NPDC004296]|uniref:hypothetical protein n=1 Tax=Streptomyces sp. NPDC004296 TaxID=3364697 RepID=UPI00368D74D6
MTKTKKNAGDADSLVYQCRLNLSTSTIVHLADLLRAHLKAIASPWRSKPPGRIAVLVLAMLRHDQRLIDLAGGNDVSESTLRRWRDEMIALLAAKSPRLDRALRKVARRGGEVGEPRPVRHTRTRRTRLRPPEVPADPHQTPHRPGQGHRAPARPARPDEPRSEP